jgi:hypothetical protein
MHLNSHSQLGVGAEWTTRSYVPKFHSQHPFNHDSIPNSITRGVSVISTGRREITSDLTSLFFQTKRTSQFSFPLAFDLYAPRQLQTPQRVHFQFLFESLFLWIVINVYNPNPVLPFNLEIHRWPTVECSISALR